MLLAEVDGNFNCDISMTLKEISSCLSLTHTHTKLQMTKCLFIKVTSAFRQ